MLISILACSLGFHGTTFEFFLMKIKNDASVALKALLLFFGRSLAHGGNKRGNRGTDGQTDRQTHSRMKYRNPRWAYVPRVNNCLIRHTFKTVRRVVLRKFLHIRGITHARNIATPIRVIHNSAALKWHVALRSNYARAI